MGTAPYLEESKMARPPGPGSGEGGTTLTSAAVARRGLQLRAGSAASSNTVSPPAPSLALGLKSLPPAAQLTLDLRLHLPRD